MADAAGTSDALRALDHALDAPRGAGVPLGNWRWSVRQRLVILRDRLVTEAVGSHDGWLAARGGAAYRERNDLLARLAALTSAVLETHDAEEIRHQLKRLVGDISHHIQRVHDLVYDDVELELGGED
ncbi:hypothetical protein [Nocardioides sp. AN3]